MISIASTHFPSSFHFLHSDVSPPSLSEGIRGQAGNREETVSNAACLETDADRPVLRIEKEKRVA